VVSVCVGADLWKYWGLVHFSSAKVAVIEGMCVCAGRLPLPSLQRGKGRVVRTAFGAVWGEAPAANGYFVVLQCSET